MSDMLRYFDHIEGRHRFKRRAIWAIWAFAGGVLVGALVAWVI